MDLKKINMFDGFKLETQKFNNINIRYRIGGKGYPLLLLHGNPQTHVMWHKVSAQLSKHFTIVASDLTGMVEVQNHQQIKIIQILQKEIWHIFSLK